MRTRAWINAIYRLSRWRSGFWWTLPVAVVGLVLTVAYSTLTRSDLTPAADRVFNYGGSNIAIYFNEYVPTTQEDFTLASAIDELDALSANTPCAEINSIVQADARSGEVFSYREFASACPPENWGFELVVGRWATGPGEVVATQASNFSTGDTIEGSTPENLTVVGIATNSNALRSQTLIAGSGTWRSWGWPEVAAAFPRLSATVVAYATADGAEEIRQFYTAKSVDSPAAGSIDIAEAGTGQSSILTRFPFLYSWIALPLAALATILALALRGRYISSRTMLLGAQGLSPLSARAIVQFSTFVPLIIACATGILAGWFVSVLGTPIVEWIAGRTPGPLQIPIDPAYRLAIGLLFVLVLMFAITLGGSLSTRRSPRSAGGSLIRKSATARQCAAIFATGLAIFTIFVVSDVSVIIGAMFLMITAIALVSPELVVTLSRIFSGESPASKLAWRRVSQRPLVAAMAVTAAAIAFGPVVGLGIVISSDISEQNSAARLPPRDGQAMYYLSDDDNVNEQVVDIVSSTSGPDFTVVSLPSVQAEGGGGVVASPDGFGAVEAIADVAALETLLGSTVSAAGKAVLEEGGVLWGPEYSGNVLWAYVGDSLSPIEVSASSTEALEERWARWSAGFILQSTASDIGLQTVDSLTVFGGVSDAEAEAIGASLANSGLDPSLVRTYRPSDPFAVSPFQWGLIGTIGTVGVALLGAAMRGSVVSLRGQNPGLLALGTPRGWLGRVYLMEGAVTLVAGVLLGGFTAIGVALLGLAQLGIAIVVPFAYIGGYMVLLALALSAIGLFGLRRIRS